MRIAPNAVRWTSLSVHKTVTDGSSTVDNLSQGQPLVMHGAVPGQPPVAPYPRTHASTHHTDQHHPQHAGSALEPHSSLQTSLSAGKATSERTVTGAGSSHSHSHHEQHACALSSATAVLNATEKQLVASLQSCHEDVHYVPVYSAWFRWDEVHEIEEAALPDFFTGKWVHRPTG